MRRIATYTAALLAMLVLASQASAAAARIEPHCGRQTARVELACATRALHRDAGTVRWIKNHRNRALLAATPLPHSLAFYRWRVRVDHGWIREAQRRLYVVSYPPHHALWMCIFRHEASTAPGRWHNEDTGNNGHYGGLQMHWSWGYGIHGDPAHYSQLQQEWAAERGYRANGYSHTWLMGQWKHYDCLGYA